jgi:hypothetical protein
MARTSLPSHATSSIRYFHTTTPRKKPKSWAKVSHLRDHVRLHHGTAEAADGRLGRLVLAHHNLHAHVQGANISMGF